MKCCILVIIACLSFFPGTTQVLNKQKMLDRFSFWNNRDWNWYKKNIPFFESPDKEIDLIYYYRWDMMTAHLVYGSPASGYVSTEFIDRPGWSGKYWKCGAPTKFLDLYTSFPGSLQ